MAADFEEVNRTKQLGNNIVQLAERTIEVRSLVAKIVASGNHCFTGNDYSKLETVAGLQAGEGGNTLFLLNLINTILNTNADVTGANRLSQLDEFCARFANQ